MPHDKEFARKLKNKVKALVSSDESAERHLPPRRDKYFANEEHR